MQSWLHLNRGPAAAGLMRWKSGDRVILVCFSLGVLCIQVNGEEISFVLNIYLHMSFSPGNEFNTWSFSSGNCGLTAYD